MTIDDIIQILEIIGKILEGRKLTQDEIIFLKQVVKNAN